MTPTAPVPSPLADFARKRGTVPKKAKALRAAVPAAQPAYARGSALLAARGIATWRKSELPKLLAALRCIPPNQGYLHWFGVGAALHNFDPVFGRVIFKAWAASIEKYNTPEHQAWCDKKWDEEYGNLKPNQDPKTIASIYDEAEARRWAPPQAPRPSELGAAATPQATPTFASTINGVHALPAAVLQLTEPIIFPDKSKNKLLATCRNTRVAIRAIGLVCEHDLFHDRLRIGGQAIAEWAGDLSDNAVHMLRVIIEQQFHFDPGTVNAHDAAVQECLQNGFDPVQDYLDDLVWDGRPRVDQWMASYLGAEASPFNSAVSRLFLLAAVRRARVPGCKFDQVVVFEGPEGRGKSSALEILAGTENFSDQTILTLDDKGQQETVQGVWIYEIADFVGHGRAENERTKALLSRTHDRARPAYGRSRVDRPRRCVFGATTNDPTYLKSQTGNRRFWPVLCGRIDLDALARDRDQLWAEAAIGERGASLILPESMWKAAGELQDSRRDIDPWDDMLTDLGKHAKTETTNKKGETIAFLAANGRPEQRITSRDVMEMVLRLPVDRVSDVTAKRVAFAMRRLGWDGPKVLRFGDLTLRGYAKPADRLTSGNRRHRGSEIS